MSRRAGFTPLGTSSPGDPPRKRSRWSLLRPSLALVWPGPRERLLRLRIGVALALLLAVRALNMLTPQALKHAVDAGGGTGAATWILAYGFMRLSTSLFDDLRRLVWIKVSNHVNKAVAEHTQRHIYGLSMRYHHARGTGALIKILERARNSMGSLLSFMLFQILPMVLDISLVTGYFAYLGWTFGLACIIVMVAYIAWTIAITEWRTDHRRAMNEESNRLSQVLTDSMQCIDTVKIFGRESYEIDRYRGVLDRYSEREITAGRSLVILNTGQNVIIAVGLLTCLLLAVRRVSQGSFSPGQLVAVNAYLLQLFRPLGWLGSSYRLISSNLTDIEQLWALLDETPDVVDADDAEVLDLGRAAAAANAAIDTSIEFDGVDFTYPSRGASSSSAAHSAGMDDTAAATSKTPTTTTTSTTSAAKSSGADDDDDDDALEAGMMMMSAAVAPPPRASLSGVSFRVPSGSRVAIVGPSGSGKSTISKLLSRLYDPSAGAVRIGGRDLRELTQASVRTSIGVVPQDTVLFNETLEYNIAYGCKERVDDDVDRREIDAAVRAAELERFVGTLPEGLATRVGERGVRLSGGERQRVSIARVVVKQPPIIVLDEATSALDTATEARVLASMTRPDASTAAATTLTIAHRLSTIVDADEILVLVDGRIVERGSHRDLAERPGGVYATMWEQQRRSQQEEEGAGSFGAAIS